MVTNLVSVIIPCYNGEKFISRSIESVFAQTYQNIELVVVDDGSVDNSKKIIQSWIEKFNSKDRILKYVYQENGGLGSAVNRGLKEITGEFLTLLDADDRFLQTSIQKRVEFLQKNIHLNAVRSNGWTVRGEQKWLFVQDESEKREDIFDSLILGRTNNWAGSYMVRTESLWKTYPDRNIYPSRFGQNLQLLLPATYKNGCGFIDEPLMEYILQDFSLSQSKNRTIENDIKRYEGYADIRNYVISKLVKAPQENEKYQKLVKIELMRNFMKLAAEYNRKDLMQKYYTQLSNLTKPTLNDKILYCQYTNITKSYFLRMIRKLSMLKK